MDFVLSIIELFTIVNILVSGGKFENPRLSNTLILKKKIYPFHHYTSEGYLRSRYRGKFSQ